MIREEQQEATVAARSLTSLHQLVSYYMLEGWRLQGKVMTVAIEAPSGYLYAQNLKREKQEGKAIDA